MDRWAKRRIGSDVLQLRPKAGREGPGFTDGPIGQFWKK